MDHSGTSVRSPRVRSRTSRRVVHSPVHHDGYAYVLGLRIVLYTTLRRPQRQPVAAASVKQGSGFRWFCRMSPFLRPVGVRVVPTCLRSALSFPQQAISTSAFLDYMKKLKYNAFVGAIFSFCIMIFVSAENRGGAKPARLHDRGRASVLQRPGAQTRNSCHHLQGRVSTGQNFETIHVGTPVFSSLPGVTVLIIVVHQDVIMDYLVRSAHNSVVT